MKQGSVEVMNGAAGLPKVVVTAGDGARAEAYLYGAHVTSWVPAGGEDWLYLSPQADFRPGESIRGGVPVVFPQFSGLGPLPKHGLVRTMTWEYVGTDQDAGRTRAEFVLRENADSLAVWPHRFYARLTLTVGGPRLAITLAVQNADDRPFTFTAALHTYFAVRELGEVSIEGLGGLPFLDATADRREKIQEAQNLRFTGEMDRIYLNAPRQVRLVEPHRSLTVAAEGFSDIVVWNPGAQRNAALGDMPPNGYLRMVCIEAAQVGQPVELAPGSTWQGSQILTC